MGRELESELKPGHWCELVRLAGVDADFRSAMLILEIGEYEPLLDALQSICRSVNCKIACEYALA